MPTSIFCLSRENDGASRYLDRIARLKKLLSRVLPPTRLSACALSPDGGRTAADLRLLRGVGHGHGWRSPCWAWSWWLAVMPGPLGRLTGWLMRSPFIGPRCGRGVRLLGAWISDSEARRSTRRCVEPEARLRRLKVFTVDLQAWRLLPQWSAASNGSALPATVALWRERGLSPPR